MRATSRGTGPSYWMVKWRLTSRPKPPSAFTSRLAAIDLVVQRVFPGPGGGQSRFPLGARPFQRARLVMEVAGNFTGLGEPRCEFQGAIDSPAVRHRNPRDALCRTPSNR